ncbi:MAG: acetoacetate decarboxylase family protein [Dehalococcoidia bacterium]|nr:acetoacetate decarboxylase family protein [Dehalococcoidia bacterium]
MPFTGTRDLSPLYAEAPLVSSPATEPWTIPGADYLQVMYELDDLDLVRHLPPALHPTIPPTVIFSALRVPESDVGPFVLAEVRVGCRSATRPRSFLARAYCTSPAAIARLREGWGYPVVEGEVTLRRQYDESRLRVAAGGRTVLEVGLRDPEPISGGDIQFLPNLNVARLLRDGAELPRLVQVDSELAFANADRGRPWLETFDGAAWSLDGARAVYPVSASIGRADVTLPVLRYLADPNKSPLEAVERV